MFKRLPCGCWLHREELQLLDWEQRHFIRGNFKAFGFKWGLLGNLTLMSPLLNFIINFRYRHQELNFVDSVTGEEVNPVVCGLRVFPANKTQ